MEACGSSKQGRTYLPHLGRMHVDVGLMIKTIAQTMLFTLHINLLITIRDKCNRNNPKLKWILFLPQHIAN